MVKVDPNEKCIVTPNKHSKCSSNLILYMCVSLLIISLGYRIFTTILLINYQNNHPKDETAYYEMWFLFGAVKYHYGIVSAILYEIPEILCSVFGIILACYTKHKTPFTIYEYYNFGCLFFTLDQLTSHIMQFRQGESYSDRFHAVNTYREYTSYHILFTLFSLLFHIVIAQYINNLRQVAGIYETITVSKAYVDLKKSLFTKTVDFQLFFKFVYHYGILIWLYAWEGDMKHFLWESGKPYYQLTYFLLSYGPFKYTEVTALIIITIHIFFTLFALLVCRKHWKYVIFILVMYETIDILFYSDLLVSNLASYFDMTEKLKFKEWFHSAKYYKPFFIFNVSFICFILFNNYIAFIQLIKLFVIDIANYTKVNLKCCKIRALMFTIFTILLTVVYRIISLVWLRIWNKKYDSDNATETFFTYVIYNQSPFRYLTSYVIFCCIASMLFLINVCLFYYFPNKQTYLINLFCQHLNIGWLFIQLSGFVYQYIKIVKDSKSFDRDSLFLMPEHLKPYLQFHIILLIILFFCSCVIIGYIYRIWREVSVEEFVVKMKTNTINYNNVSYDTRVVFDDDYESGSDEMILLFTDDGIPVYIPTSALKGTEYYETLSNKSSGKSKTRKSYNKNGVVDYTPLSWEPCPGASPVTIPINNSKTVIPPNVTLPTSLNENLIDVDEEEED